jgi:hypothetical protein
MVPEALGERVEITGEADVDPLLNLVRVVQTRGHVR